MWELSHAAPAREVNKRVKVMLGEKDEEKKRKEKAPFKFCFTLYLKKEEKKKGNWRHI
jgi:hypothetical protein